ncbi:MAG: HAMP domain-containing histidine kinase [Clostridiales bacterium]|nr:HAMP domain-containing histidine kinase [Clostridiales bacterium]
MKIRSFLIYCACFLVTIVLAGYYIGTMESRQIESYPTEINRLSLSLGRNWDEVSAKSKTRVESDQPFDYAVIDNDGNLLVYTREGISTSVSSATTHYDVIRDVVTEDGQIVGKILVHNTYQEQQVKRNQRIAVIVGGFLLAMLAASAGFYFYLKKRVVDPFDEMKGFASKVASGNLDVPIKMDKGNVFGAFTEAFDIMRDELRASKLREAEAVKARKELVAQLSHDIKTPVTSIKAMTDVMELEAKSEDEKTTLRSINAKADQIDTLVSNLFHATLEELEHLEVKDGEVTSQDIARFIEEADYLKKVKGAPVSIVDAVVSADPLRLNQVIGNIFANSYKYANTDMTVNSRIEKGVDGKSFLVVEIGDHGGGVPEEEIKTIFGKFKRGTNAEGKDGAGLGLYISRYLMEKMGGEITCLNRDGGLRVILRLLLL